MIQEKWTSFDKFQKVILCLLAAMVVLFALLMGNNDWTIREFFISRDDVEDDLAWLLAEEKKFWGYVERNEEPPEILPDI